MSSICKIKVYNDPEKHILFIKYLKKLHVKDLYGFDLELGLHFCLEAGVGSLFCFI